MPSITINPQAAERALLAFIQTINATGGLVELANGELVPAGDEDWPDLADAYVSACKAVGHEPRINEVRE